MFDKAIGQVVLFASSAENNDNVMSLKCTISIARKEILNRSFIATTLFLRIATRTDDVMKIYPLV